MKTQCRCLTPIVILHAVASIAIGQTNVPWRQMASIYGRLSMPVPPTEYAPCVVEFYGKRIAFASREGRDDRFYVGHDIYSRTTPVLRSVRWLDGDFVPQDIQILTVLPFNNPFISNNGLATAIQCHMRGLTNLATHLAKVSLEQGCGTQYGLFWTPPNADWIEATYRMAWSFWGERLLAPEVPRAAALTNMNIILSSCPALWSTGRSRPGKEASRTNDVYRLMTRLARTVEWEREVAAGLRERDKSDALVDVSYPSSADLALRPDHLHHDDSAFKMFVFAPKDSGIDDLLEQHIDDERLTRAYRPMHMNMEARHLSVGDLVKDIIKRRSGQTDASGTAIEDATPNP